MRFAVRKGDIRDEKMWVWVCVCVCVWVGVGDIDR